MTLLEQIDVNASSHCVLVDMYYGIHARVLLYSLEVEIKDLSQSKRCRRDLLVTLKGKRYDYCMAIHTCESGDIMLSSLATNQQLAHYARGGYASQTGRLLYG